MFFKQSVKVDLRKTFIQNNIYLKISKQIFWMTLVSAPFVFLGCMPKIGEEPPAPIEQKISGVDCLGGSFQSMELFFQGEASNSEIQGSFSCMDTVLDKFVKLVRGKVKGKYETQELADFIEGNFFSANPELSSKKISPNLQLEVMKLKRIFLGGSLYELTVDEIQQLRNLLSQVKSLLIRLNFAMKVLSFNWNPYRDFTFLQTSDLFEKSNLEFQNFILDFTNLILRKDAVYELKDFQVLFAEFDKFYGKNWGFVKEIQNYTPVAGKIKKALNGGSEESIQSNEWKGVLLLAGRGYTQFLRYHYFLREEAEQKFGASTRLPYFAKTFEDVLSMFGQLIEIKSTARLTVEELREVGQAISQAWPELKISDQFIRELMRLKTLLFGGSEIEWTNKDFFKGQSKVSIAQGMIEKILPYYQVYGLDWKSDANPYIASLQELQRAEGALVSVIPELRVLFERDLNLDEVLKFVKEFEKINQQHSSRSELISKQIENFLPLVKLIKSKLFGDKGHLIKGSQWPQLGFLLGEGYGQFLHYHYFVQPLGLQSELFPSRLADLVQSISPYGLKTLQAFPRKEIQRRDLKSIIMELRKNGFLSYLQESTVDQILDLALNRLMVSPQDRLSGNSKLNVLNEKKWTLLIKEIETWLLPEVFFASQVPRNGNIDLETLVRRTERRLQSSSTAPTEKLGLQESLRLLDHPFSLHTDTQGRVVVDPSLSSIKMNLASVSRVNLSRTISRLLLRTYGEDLGRIQSYSGLLQGEIEKAVSAVRPLLKDFGLETELSPTFVTSRFFEANIFTPHADGNQILGYEEASELVTLIFSGLKLSSQFRQEFDKSCGTYGLPASSFVDYQCLLNTTYQHIPRHMRSLPQFLVFRDQVAPLEFGRYFYDVVSGAGEPPRAELRSRLADIALAPHLIQYIEMTYWKFDLDRNNLIDYQEARNAFPVFEGLLLDLTKDQKLLSKNDMFPLFCYLLYYGAAPGIESFGTWLLWKSSPSKWQKVSVGRTQVAGILAMIRAMMNQNSEAEGQFTE